MDLWPHNYGFMGSAAKAFIIEINESENIDLLEQLFENVGDKDIQDSLLSMAFFDGMTLLQNAVEWNKQINAKWLVDKGANLNVRDNIGMTVLHFVAKKSFNLTFAKYLVDKGADVNAQDNYGLTVLHRAYNSDNVPLIKYLVNIGANVDVKDKSGKTVLHRAAEKNQEDLVKWLVENGANVHIKDNNSKTVLHKAAEANQQDLVKWLVKNGADVNA